MLKLMRKTITILLIISLIYANAAGSVFSIISYALENDEEIVATEEVEEIEDFSLKIETSEFCKNNMSERETEYQEKVKLNVETENDFDEIKINDIEVEITKGEEQTEENEQNAEETPKNEEKINIFYKSTKINKDELVKFIGENGKLEIEYIELEKEEDEENRDITEENVFSALIPEEQEIITISPSTSEENKTTEPVIEMPVENEQVEENVGIINAETGSVIINAETESDEDGNITVIYPEKRVIALNINITTENKTIENFEILNTRLIEKVSTLEEVKVLETTKQIIVNSEEEIFNKEEINKMSINYTKTVAEIGIDKNQISTSIDNKVNFTITMLTDSIKYDLYKNPQFILELPSEIAKINVDNAIILNNNNFEIEPIETGTLANGNKGIAIKLKGEQIEHTSSNEENVQIIIETTIATERLMPTLEKNINLYYRNENATTYDGISMQEAGMDTMLVNLVSNKEVIVETKATVGEETVSSFEEDFNTINVAPHTYNMAKINGTVINNIGADIVNAKILGTVKNINPLFGVENVYYTENGNATVDINDIENGWTTEYTQNAKKYLILIENFKQAQKVYFEYYMYMPEVVEDDITYELSYEVYDSNNEMLKTSQVTINQEAERFDYYEDEKIQANLYVQNLDNTEQFEIGDILYSDINIKNISETNLKNVSIHISLPTILVDDISLKINGQEILEHDISRNEKEFIIENVTIEKGANFKVEIKSAIEEYIQPREQIKVEVHYEQEKAEVSDKIKVIEPSDIEAKITSDKMGQSLEANEYINYKVILTNTGKSSSDLEVKLPEENNVFIQKIESINLTTGKTNSMTSGDLTGASHLLSIQSGETVEIKIEALTKELSKDANQLMYVSVLGKGCNETTSNQLVNKINKYINETEEINEEEAEEIIDETIDDTNEKKENSIKGIAWIDKDENGKQDKNELVLKGVQAVLIDTTNSKQVATAVTNNNGEYIFKNLDDGKYVVTFNYNTTTFSVTDYKTGAVSEELDSDVISATQNSKNIAKTEIIDLETGKTENVNIGLVLNKEFDMSISKGITKVSVSNEKGTNVYEFPNTSMAKVEIEGEYLKGSLILVEYEIAVTNSGEVAGYAKMISDKIPEGMKFNSELNTNWYQDDDGILYCEELVNKELLPGETAIVKLVLTKEMTDDKIVSPVNTVKLEEIFNEYLIEDKKKENNVSEATIIISLTTGKMPSYIWLVLIVIAIISTGIFGVSKITNKDYAAVNSRERRK